MTMKYLRIFPAVWWAAGSLVRQALQTRREIIAAAGLGTLGPFAVPMPRNELISESKTRDVWIVDGEPVLVETWLLTYQDGQHDTLQRRHPVTNPAERAIFLNDTETFE